MQKYVFRKYCREYRRFFRLEKQKLATALGSKAKLEHVGSTAVPGLGGKGIVDLAVGVSKSGIAQARKKLEKTGYEFREDASTKDRLFFRIDWIYKNRKRRVHIHLTSFAGKDWTEMLRFRDYLLMHPKAACEYAEIKKTAVRKARGKGAVYRKCKEKFITAVVKKAVK